MTLPMELRDIDSRIGLAKAAIEAGMVIDEETGEVTFDTTELESLQMEKEEKLEAVAIYIKWVYAFIDDIRDEEKALEARRDEWKNKAERVENAVIESMDKDGIRKFETKKCKIELRKSSAVVIDDPSLIAKQYIRVKTTEEPDKVAIGKAIRAGEEIPGAYIEERRSVIVK